MGNLPSISLSQSRDFSKVIFQKREKNGRNPRFPACHCFSSRRKTTGWFWIPVLIIIIDSTGAESAKHLHNLSGSTCVFPFVYNGATHFQCTYSDSPTPW